MRNCVTSKFIRKSNRCRTPGKTKKIKIKILSIGVMQEKQILKGNKKSILEKKNPLILSI